MKYRAEIDGLRALAVLPVIFFHAGFESFSGGFVGVDVFFVISGYLITTIIISQISVGKFSIVYFYERRARRILPALFFMMIACLPFAYMWLMPSDLKDFGQSLIAVSTFSSNFLFWLETGYFDTESDLKPLLHTWSLAVEEQYYIIFPVFLVLAWHLGIKRIIFILLFIFLVSLGIAQWSSINATTSNFYLLPSRGWELLIGVFAAFYLHYNNHFKSGAVNQFLSFLGFSMIVYAIINFDETTPFPSLFALIPTIGTLLLILFAVPQTAIYRLLSLKPIIGIGLISYSAYLWHQPILAFTKHYFIGAQPSKSLLFILCIASLVIGWLSWRFIEKPFRDKDQIKKRQIFLISSLMIVFFLSIGSFFHIQDGFSERVPKELTQAHLRKEAESCNFQFQDTINKDYLYECLKSADIFLVGDSHAQAISFSLEKALNITDHNLVTITSTACLPIAGVSRKNSPKSCIDLINFLYEKVFINGNNVIFSARWRLNIEGNRYDNGEGGIEVGDTGQVYLDNINEHENLIDALTNKIEYLNKKTNLIIVNQIPEVGVNVPNWYFRMNTPLTHSYIQYLNQNARIHDMFDNVNDLNVLRSDALVCSKKSDRCSTRLGAELLYFDDDHPSTLFSKIIAERIISQNFKN